MNVWRKWSCYILCCICIAVPISNSYAISTGTNVKSGTIEVVRAGESLYSIAKRYHTTVKTLRQLNGLSDNRIVPGQALIVPGSKIIIHSGSNLWSIAASQGLTIRELRQVNPNLKSQVLKAGSILNIPQTKYTVDTGLFFVPTYKNQEDRALLKHYSPFVRRIGLFEIPIRENGSLDVRSFGQSSSIIRQMGSFPYPVITNLTKRGFDPKLMHQILNDKSKRQILTESIWHLVKANHFRGVMLDLERIQPNDRHALNFFLKELHQKLHPSRMEITISVPPKQGDTLPDYNNGYDYKTIGRYVDRMFIMAYDWHIPPFTEPGAIAPYPLVKATMQYASTAISRKKLYLGIPMYGYDWDITAKKGRALSQTQSIQRAVDHSVPIHFDFSSRSPFYRYRDQQGHDHRVWFEDARSIASKYELVKRYHWKGLGGWQMKFSFPQAETLLWLKFHPL
jgi:spore germination protein